MVMVPSMDGWANECGPKRSRDIEESLSSSSNLCEEELCLEE